MTRTEERPVEGDYVLRRTDLGDDAYLAPGGWSPFILQAIPFKTFADADLYYKRNGYHQMSACTVWRVGGFAPEAEIIALLHNALVQHSRVNHSQVTGLPALDLDHNPPSVTFVWRGYTYQLDGAAVRRLV